MISTKKVNSMLLVIVFVFGIFSLNPISAIGIQNFWVEASPRKVGAIAEYRFHFSLEKKLALHQWIGFEFPSGTKLTPPLPAEGRERTEWIKNFIESIQFNNMPCSNCQGLVIFNFNADDSMSLQFHPPSELESEKEIIITFSNKAGITNPVKPGTYSYKVKTQQELKYVESLPVEIVESKIRALSVSVDNFSINQVSGYKIKFLTGDGGRLFFGRDTINLVFPKGTKFSTPMNTIERWWITINDKPIPDYPLLLENTLILPISCEIPATGFVMIQIHEKIGIKNPLNPGAYFIQASTSVEVDAVESESFEIKKAITELLLTVEPPKTGRIAQYNLTFVLETMSLKASDEIQIEFSGGIILPEKINPFYVLVNGNPVEKITVLNQNVFVTLTEMIVRNKGVEICFCKEAGIQNPINPSSIRIILKMSAGETLRSEKVNIQIQELEIRQIHIEPPNANAIASYQISLTFGDHQIPSIGEKIFISLSNIEDPIEWIVKESLMQDYLIVLDQVPNPSDGSYFIKIATTKESKVIAEKYTILPAIPFTKIKYDRESTGNNGWYREPPSIFFECDDPTSILYLSNHKDFKDAIILFGPLKTYRLEGGQYIHSVYFYAKNCFGQEKPKSVEFKVDMIPPEFDVQFTEKVKIQTRQKNVIISGKVSAIATEIDNQKVFSFDKNLFIDNLPVKVNERDGTFSSNLSLSEGDNLFQINLEDEAGNRSGKEISFFCDSIPPTIQILSPTPYKTYQKNPIFISGKTEPLSYLLVNGKETDIQIDGSFQQIINLSPIGMNSIKIEATDSFGNTSIKVIPIWSGIMIHLQIGSREASTNGIEKKLTIPPFILHGKTMVPFRFIGEELGAKIDFTIDQKTRNVKTVSYTLNNACIILTIGSRTAFINNRKIILEVPPYIIYGNTLIPLRFVSEGLGCRVQWEAVSQRITIEYPILI